MSPTVVVVGDANLDLVLTGDVVPRFGQAEQLLDRADLVIGGSAGIMACGLARLGVSTALAAVVGDDAFGEQMRSLLSAAGVDLRWLRTDPVVPTGLSVILSGTDRAILTHPGTVASTDAGVLPPLTELAGVRHVHSASMFLQPRLAPALASFAASLRERGITSSLDTNWDPAEQWTAAREVIEAVDVFLPNTAELLAISGQTDVEAAGSSIATHGTTVALKNGAEGGIAWGQGGLRTAASGLDVDVVDTTGAGDSFDAGFLSAWIDGLGLDECLRRAVVAGSLSTRTFGGTGAQPTLDEVITAGTRP